MQGINVHLEHNGQNISAGFLDQNTAQVWITETLKTLLGEHGVQRGDRVTITVH